MNTPPVMQTESGEWVVKIIESCQNGFHLECARKLIDCFKERYGECDQYHLILEAYNAKSPMIMVV